MFLQPAVDTDQVAEIIYGSVAGSQEEIHAGHEKNHVQDARYDDPSPEFMLPDELVCFEIGLEGYDDLFEQQAGFNA